MDSPDSKSAINFYDMHERHLLRHTKAEKSDYDLLSIIMIYLGTDDSSNKLVRFLKLLFYTVPKDVDTQKEGMG